MNKKIYIALAGLLSLSISVFLLTHRQLKHSRSQVQNSRFGEFKFEEKIYDFGQIKSGDTVSHNFRFLNKGTVPLVIEDISTSCGCTVASWPKNPIPSNNNGKILLTFSKSHQPGVYNKTAIIKANTKDTYTAIRIRATVVE